MDKPRVFYIAQGKEPFLVQIFTPSDVTLDWDATLNRRAIDTIRRCLDDGRWPGYSDGVIEVDMPAWVEKQLTARHQKGDFNPVDWTKREPAP